MHLSWLGLRKYQHLNSHDCHRNQFCNHRHIHKNVCLFLLIAQTSSQPDSGLINAHDTPRGSTRGVGIRWLGQFTYVDVPPEGVPMAPPTHPDARFYGTTEIPNIVEQTAGKIQEKMNRE